LAPEEIKLGAGGRYTTYKSGCTFDNVATSAKSRSNSWESSKYWLLACDAVKSLCNGDRGNSVNIVETVAAKYPRALGRFSNISTNWVGHNWGPSDFLCNL